MFAIPQCMMRDSLPQQVRFIIEVPRGGFIKWGAYDGVDFLSPLPCPFNYGSAPDHPGQDGDPADVVVLGVRLARGATGQLPVRGRVRFVDQGVRDDKWICAAEPLRRRHRLLVVGFFRFYALPKSLLGAIRRAGPSQFEGLDLSDSMISSSQD